MPARLEEVKNQLSNWIRDQSKALQLKPIDDSVKQARAREIPQLKFVFFRIIQFFFPSTRKNN